MSNIISNSKLSIKRFLLPSILIISLISLSVSIFQMSKPNPSIIKYVDSQRIQQPIVKEIYKTVGEMMAPRLKEVEVLGEKINNLEKKKKVKSYLGTAETKELKENKEKQEKLAKKINKESQEQIQRMAQSKFTKVQEIINSIAKKHNYTIQPIETNQLIKTAICREDDVTDLVLAELGISEEKKAKA